MNFDYDRKKEYKKFVQKKEQEEKLLREKGVSEEHIKQLRDMDTLMFNEERKHLRHQEVVKEDFWATLPAPKSNKDIVNIADLLDELENEILLEIIKNSDKETQRIVELKYQGFVLREIAELTNLSIDQIKRRIQKIRIAFKKNQK